MKYRLSGFYLAYRTVPVNVHGTINKYVRLSVLNWSPCQLKSDPSQCVWLSENQTNICVPLRIGIPLTKCARLCHWHWAQIDRQHSKYKSPVPSSLHSHTNLAVQSMDCFCLFCAGRVILISKSRNLYFSCLAV